MTNRQRAEGRVTEEEGNGICGHGEFERTYVRTDDCVTGAATVNPPLGLAVPAIWRDLGTRTTRGRTRKRVKGRTRTRRERPETRRAGFRLPSCQSARSADARMGLFVVALVGRASYARLWTRAASSSQVTYRAVCGMYECGPRCRRGASKRYGGSQAHES